MFTKKISIIILICQKLVLYNTTTKNEVAFVLLLTLNIIYTLF